MTVNLDSIANLYRLLVPALADKFDRGQAANVPDGFFTGVVCDSDVVTNMRVLEPDFFDNAFDGRGFVRVEFRDIGMVRLTGERDEEDDKCQ